MRIFLALSVISLTFATPVHAQQGAAALSCTERQGSCNRMLGQYGAEWGPKCKQAGDECRRTGTFVAPYSGTVFSNVPKR